LPALDVEPAFELGPAVRARWGALRFEVKRHPSLRLEADLPLRLALAAASGAKAAASMVIPGGQESAAVLVDTTSLEEAGAAAGGRLFPLRAEIAIGEGGQFSEVGELKPAR
jgi:hypothetical protein